MKRANKSIPNYIKLYGKQPHLLFKASVHSKALKTFHDLCDNQGETIFLAVLLDDLIVGAYVSVLINSKPNKRYKDDNAFIFTYIKGEFQIFNRRTG